MKAFYAFFCRGDDDVCYIGGGYIILGGVMIIGLVWQEFGGTKSIQFYKINGTYQLILLLISYDILVSSFDLGSQHTISCVCFFFWEI